jgi:phosphatidylserine/phosphatidylglycerophosphate/cardiolipin synthase-like enzyme
VQGHFILDKAMFYSSSCTRQAERVNALYEAGIAAGQPDLLRLHQPGHGMYSSMHVKTTIIDELVIYSGSPNMTHNGLEHNKEHLFRMTQANVVASVVTDFEATWMESQPVTQVMIELMKSQAVERARKKAESSGQHTRRNRSVSLNRSLSTELRQAGR